MVCSLLAIVRYVYMDSSDFFFDFYYFVCALDWMVVIVAGMIRVRAVHLLG